jgi:hypothetical protein
MLGTLTDFFLGDTYSEIQNGEVVDFFCLDNSRVDTLGFKPMVRTMRSCLVYQAEHYDENSHLIYATDGYGNCEKNVFCGSFVCEFSP